MSSVVLVHSISFSFPLLNYKQRFLTHMLYTANFEGSPDVGVYARLTNDYVIVGKSNSKIFYSSFQKLNIPIVETLINTIGNVGSQCVGNKRGLLLSYLTTDDELQHIRNSLPEHVKVRKVDERLNALGNNFLVNDKYCLAHCDVTEETMSLVADVLGVEVFKMSIGPEPAVGSFAHMNNHGILVHPRVTVEEQEELSQLLSLQIIAGTVNKGKENLGGGMLVNDYVGFVGHQTTVHERTVISSVFGLHEEDEEVKRNALIDEYVN